MDVKQPAFDPATLSIAEWQERLERHFSTHGVVGGRLLPLIATQEEATGRTFIDQYRGHRVLTDSFLDFFACTLETAAQWISHKGLSGAHPYYGPWFSELLTIFHGFRAAECLSLSGYAFEAYGLQRSTLEQIIGLGAAVLGYTSLAALSGIAGLPTDKQWGASEKKQSRKNREAEYGAVRRKMFGAESGLDLEHVSMLEHWHGVFHMQVHRSRLTAMFSAGAWLFDRSRPISIGPMPNEDAAAAYMNRTVELGWMTLRLVPTLQLEDRTFDAAWMTRWRVLDESFHRAAWAMTTQVRTEKLGRAMLTFIERKFAIDPSQGYLEARITPPES